MPTCPYCYSSKMRKYGFYYYGGEARQKWLCEKCGGITAYALARKPKRRPRRLRGR